MLKGAEAGRSCVPGKPDESPLIEAIRYEGDVQMPPKGKLKDEEIAALTEWVKRGALWPDATSRAAPAPRRRHRRLPVRASRAARRIHRDGHGSAAVILVVPAVTESSTTGGPRRRMARFADRPVHSGQARRKRPGAVAGG